MFDIFIENSLDNPALANWKAWGSFIANKLIKKGVCQKAIEGIDLFEFSDTSRMTIRSKNGMFDITSNDVRLLVMARWLVDHADAEETDKFQLCLSRFNNLLLTINQIDTSGAVYTGQRVS